MGCHQSPDAVLSERKYCPGVDVNHREILISSGAKAGERYDIAILAYSGSVPGDLIIRTELVRVDDAVEKGLL